MKKISARGIIIKNDKVLLIYREKAGDKYYSIPGGKIEVGEKLEETVVREVLEETSINVKPLKYLGVFVGNDTHFEQHLFQCEYINGEPKLGDAIEKEIMSKDPTNFYRPEWVAIKDVITLKIRPDSAEEFFKDYVKKPS
jgi:8-oxo-dGTP pyrophosphatase MutT (NUDIX family)